MGDVPDEDNQGKTRKPRGLTQKTKKTEGKPSKPQELSLATTLEELIEDVNNATKMEMGIDKDTVVFADDIKATEKQYAEKQLEEEEAKRVQEQEEQQRKAEQDTDENNQDQTEVKEKKKTYRFESLSVRKALIITWLRSLSTDPKNTK